MKLAGVISVLVLITAGCSTTRRYAAYPKQQSRYWHAVHLINYNSNESLVKLGRKLPVLARMGINTIILEVDYHFAFKSHPELSQGPDPITRHGARRFAALCRRNGIRIIPEFECLGHQSWADKTFPLLSKYPQLGITPGLYPGNDEIYCREWNPLDPRVNKMVFQLMDELIDAFNAPAFHVGMDEIFLLGADTSPSTRGKNRAALFAKTVNEIHHHLVDQDGVEMLMWGDRLIDGQKYDYGEWESSLNGTFGAIDRIPKDIIICDWHYEKRDNGYPSINLFLKKGFRVLSSTWRNVTATDEFISYSMKQDNPRFLGNIFTFWSHPKNLTKYPSLVQGLKLMKKIEQRSDSVKIAAGN